MAAGGALVSCIPAPTTAGALPEASAETVGEFHCTACCDVFEDAEGFRKHCQAERHVYNTKRKLAGLKPIAQEAWDRKVKESARAAGAQHKGTSHLKPGKEQRLRKNSDDAIDTQSVSEAGTSALLAPSDTREEGPPSPRESLFDRRRFKTVGECIEYMTKTYSFYIPDAEYCTNVEGLLLSLRAKLAEPPHQCLFCNRPFPDAASVRRHMVDKGHCRIGTETYSRKGHFDKVGTDNIQAELEEFYDYHGSTREIMERFKDPQKVGALLRHFDADGDDRLCFRELAALWAAASDGAELSQAQYQGACDLAQVKAKEGLDENALARLYASGLADLNAHFAMLTDSLSIRKPKQAAAEEASPESPETAASEETKAEGAESDDEAGSSEEDEDAEVVELEDEDEFAEVMRTLGLQPVEVTDGGDLRLPSGAVVGNRDMGHIYRQRGTRMDPAMALQCRTAPVGRRTVLMLSNAPAGSKAALTQRQEAREGRRMLYVLKKKVQMDVRLQMQQNLLKDNRVMKSRTVRGDATGAGGAGR